jgi:hypothetical protein
MIYIKDHKTGDMFEAFPELGPKRKQRMESSWAKIFRDHILPRLPVEKLFARYDPVKGAPTKELYSILGLMVIQQMNDLTDEEAVDQFAYNLQWHYALNITSTADSATYVSPKTLWTMRHLLTKQNLYYDIFNDITKKLAEIFTVDFSKQRIDSAHIFSNMRHLGRIGLFVKTIKKFLLNLKRHHKNLYDSLDQVLAERYITKKGEAVFSMVKPSASMKTLAALAEDAFALAEQFKGNDAVAVMTSYQLLVRLLREQCVVERSPKNAAKITVKANKDVASDSMQNPSDPDAAYNARKGQGYQVQLAENYSTPHDPKMLSLLTSIMVEPTHKHDAHALIPLIESGEKAGRKPQKVIADAAYGGDDNCGQARQLGVEVIAPLMGTDPPPDVMPITDFSLSQEREVLLCPQGQAPEKTRNTNGQHTAIFKKEICQACVRRKQCSIISGKRSYYLRYSDKSIRVAQRRAQEKTPEFRDQYRYRAAIEGTISQFDRLCGIKRLRVRGLSAVSCAVFLKAAGINIIRATAFWNSLTKGKYCILSSFTGIFYIIKERFRFFLPPCINLSADGFGY